MSVNKTVYKLMGSVFRK